MKLKNLLLVALVGLIIASCSTPRIAYFQDLQEGRTEEVLQQFNITVQPQDRISIVVNSRDPELADLFNLPIVSHRVGYTQNSGISTAQQMSSYTVDPEGYVDFPVLGKIQVKDKTRVEIAQMIKNELIARSLVNDPVVTVEFMNMFVNVMGEVKSPGRYTFDRDRMSLLDALAMAGDLTIQGERTNVMVLREENGKQTVYTVDLTSGYNLLSSPAFYLQQRDVIYVSPNTMRQRQSTVNGNNVLSTSFWLSLTSVLINVVLLIIKL